MKINRVVLILFLAALFLRIAYIFTLDNVNLGAWGDEGWKIAKNLVEGKGYKMLCGFGDLASGRPPVFPLFLAGIFLIFGQNIVITKILLAFFGAILCLAIFFLGKTIFNSKVGLIAMVISVFYPAFIYWGGYLTPEILATLFLVLVTLFILQLEKNLVFYSILSGLFLGILVMTRSTAYGLIPLISLWIFFFSKDRKQAAKAISIMLVSVSFVVSPWVIRNYKIHHTLLLASTEGGMTFFEANNPETLTKGGGDLYFGEVSPKGIEHLSEVEADRYYYRKGLNFVRTNPMLYLRLMFERFIRFWRFYPHICEDYKQIHLVICFLADAPLILLGLWGLIILYKKTRKQALLFALIFFNFTIVAMLIRSCIRYRIVIMPHLIILASFIIFLFYKRLKISNGN